MVEELSITYIGGPTALLELGGFRLLTDPTFDPPGDEYQTGPFVLRKLSAPAVTPGKLGHVDVVLLSHDQHFDNLDHSGRAFLPSATHVITTRAAAKRLDCRSVVGLAEWENKNVTILRWAHPKNHGRSRSAWPPRTRPRPGLRFYCRECVNTPKEAVYVSGDTVWFDGLSEVANRFHVNVASLFMGAAIVPAVGPWHLTMTAREAVRAARTFPSATIVPLHFEGWQHFTEDRSQIAATFASEGMQDRLVWPDPGNSTGVGRAPL